MEEQRNQQRPAEMEEQRNRLKPAEMEKQHQQLGNQMKPAETEKEQQQRQQREEEEDKPREKRREQEQTLQNHSVSVPTPSPPPSVNTQSSESYKDPKRRSPSSDSPLSSDNSSLSHGSSPRGPPQSQPSYPSYPNSLPPVSTVADVKVGSESYPSYPNSLPPVSTVADVKVGSESPDFVSTVEVEEPKINSGSGRRLRSDLSILRRIKRERMVKRVLLGFRTCGFACCLVALSVLAADKDQGWALDSFYRYREFRYSMAVTVIGFVYSAFQAYDLAYGLATSEQKTRPPLRYYLDFSLDQIISYLLLSASSSAAVRVDDWQSNWGEDKFPEMAKASVALSFIAFISMALSSVVSGYTLCTLKSI